MGDSIEVYLTTEPDYTAAAVYEFRLGEDSHLQRRLSSVPYGTMPKFSNKKDWLK